MLIDLVIMIEGNICDRAVVLNARVYVMAQCKGDAGTFVASGSKTVAACCRIVSRTIGTAGFTEG